jgi:hypothetical protein
MRKSRPFQNNGVSSAAGPLPRHLQVKNYRLTQRRYKMWLVIFGLVCFWSGMAAMIARLCSLPVLPIMLVVGILAGVILTIILSMCQSAGTPFPEDGPIDIQTYFGGTFKFKNYLGGERSSQ